MLRSSTTAFWEHRFDKRTDIVGLTVHIDGAPATIIGVMPERFDFPMPVEDDLWVPLTHTPDLQQRGISNGFTAAARLRDGTSLREARVELETINRRLDAAYPMTNGHLVPTVATHSQTNSGRNAPMIWGSLFAAAWFVLLMACANVANLTLVRTMGRWRELSTRIALGAGQGRMMRQMFTESVVLAVAAAAIGWWITNWSVRTWIVVTASRYQVLDYTIDSGTLCRSRFHGHLGREEPPIFPLGQRSMKAQQGGRFEDDRRTDQPARSHEERTQAGDNTIQRNEDWATVFETD
jgi:hypothetical protein